MLLYQLGYLKNRFTSLLRYPQHCWGKGVTNSTVAYKLYISVYNLQEGKKTLLFDLCKC